MGLYVVHSMTGTQLVPVVSLVLRAREEEQTFGTVDINIRDELIQG